MEFRGVFFRSFILPVVAVVIFAVIGVHAIPGGIAIGGLCRLGRGGNGRHGICRGRRHVPVGRGGRHGIIGRRAGGQGRLVMMVAVPMIVVPVIVMPMIIVTMIIVIVVMIVVVIGAVGGDFLDAVEVALGGFNAAGIGLRVGGVPAGSGPDPGALAARLFPR